MNIISKLVAGLTAALLLSMPVASLAADDGLYEKPVDPNSAFVRVLSPNTNVAVIDGKTLNSLSNGLSPYVNVQPGDIAVTAGDTSGTVPAQPGAYYTLTWGPDGKPLVIQDAAPTDPSKAEVYLYNLSDKTTVNLFVPAAKVDAIADV